MHQVARVMLGHSLAACGDSANAAEVFRDLRVQLEDQASLKSSMRTFYRMNKLNLLATSTFADKVRLRTATMLFNRALDFY